MTDPISNISIMGILLAAGRGRRMGTTKQLLPWPTLRGEIPLVAASFDAIAAYCTHMVVVVGDESAICDALGGREYTAMLADSDAPMYESVRAGIGEVIGSNATHVLLHPGDHPQVLNSTVGALMSESYAHPEAAIMPEYEGKGGHPALIPRSHWKNIVDATGDGGLRAFWRAHADRVIRVPVDDVWVTVDLDTQDEYDAARKRLG